MSGAHIRIDWQVDISQALSLLNRLVLAGQDLTEPFADFGEHLLTSHRERWQRQESPEGDPWAPLSPRYQARKAKSQDLILVLDGYLRDTLAYDPRSDALEFGTSRIQGATHQFGDPARGIPARPFLGLSSDDEAELLAILGDYLEDALK